MLSSAWMLMGAPSAARADPQKGAVLAAQGNAATGLPSCSACHGQSGEGDTSSDAMFPRVAGLSKSYLLTQLEDFRAGRRTDDTMQPIAKLLSTAEAEDLAEYFSSATAPSDPGTFPADLVAKGRELATHGKWSVGLPACESCHAPNGIGVAPDFPYLADQRAPYIEQQLKDWRAGTRRNDPLGLMKSVADKLQPDDIQAVAAYFQSLNAPSRQGAN
jgi:cytochrome c553